MNKSLYLGRRVFNHTLFLSIAIFTCAALSANDHEKGDKAHGSKQHGSKEQKAEKFVQEATMSGKLEVQMGQLAQQNGQNQEVKKLGAALVRDHTQANQRLQQIASKQNIQVHQHQADHQQKHAKDLEKLQGKSGAEFDKMFVKNAIKHHKKDIAKFEQFQQELQNPELKAFIEETLPKLRNHLQMAQSAARDLGLDESSFAAEWEAEGELEGVGAPASIETSRGNENDLDVDVDSDANLGDDNARFEADADVNADATTGDDERIFQEGDGKILGLPTDKDDGSFLGIIPNPRADNDDAGVEAEADIDVDTDNNTSDIGSPATGTSGADSSELDNNRSSDQPQNK